MSTIGALREARAAQSRTAREVAQAAGLHENTIRNAESGRNSPTLEAVEAWASALGLRVVVVEDADKKSAECAA
jgi:transcriptional regulator with XRE-family HTH domain